METTSNLELEEAPATVAVMEEGDTDGVVRELGNLGDKALIYESGLARMLGKHPVSVKRAVKRGELPPPTKLGGQPVWTAGAIHRHIEGRLNAAAKQAEQEATRLRGL